MCLAALLAVSGANLVQAHFLVLLPAKDVIEAQDPRAVEFAIAFTHPMEQGPVMEMGAPRQFGMVVGDRKIDLRETLQPRKLEGKTVYSASVKLNRPGDHVFFLEPAPYWEPAEEKWIVHYTKVIVDFMGAEEGWDRLVGLPVEIEPLVRPYGLWTGNTFRGIVRRNGQPVPFATIEVEYYNEEGRVEIPNSAFVTQVIKADANGVFAYSIPRAGWWGFAALVEGEKLPGPTGQPADVELGGLIWVKAVDMQGPVIRPAAGPDR
jgi:cobalt/nickel transport protein